MRCVSRPHRGFTLLELIVVIAVIAILAALLFPVFARARDQARKIRCTSNLRQLAFALRAYADDHDGFSPPHLGTPKTFEGLRQRWFLDPLRPYVKNFDVFHCPSDNVSSGERATGAALFSMADDPRIPHVSYGVNGWLGGWPNDKPPVPGTNHTNVPYPSQTAMIADCAIQVFDCVLIKRRDGTRVSSVAYANAIRPRDEIGICDLGVPGEERHISGSNIAFVDGHVQFVQADQFLERKEVRNGVSFLVQYPVFRPTAIPPE